MTESLSPETLCFQQLRVKGALGDCKSFVFNDLGLYARYKHIREKIRKN